ncbi:hypothetical protein RYH75_19150 [Stenotrophomonas geniculata]|uniref:hypothetical protein n=1 Tax=Stenotrophomonas geniculata TaxID=86188 RepID=UPI00294A668F|nr:hypothetical protein [Stenotrophomonas geniculata]MDV6191377.1 hypothetical protein [Stenotrophomonas geniculata]
MSTLRRLAPWCFALALVIYLRPYTGIRHDATLYLAQALRLLDPDIFNRDLFFVAGSQADFTLFPQLLASLLRHFQPGDLFLVLSLLGRIAFYGASWYLIRALFPPAWRWPSLLALIVMPTRYGAYSIFAYAEPFLTSRPYAEAMALFGLGFLVRRKHMAGILVLGAAGILHPLQGFAAVLLAWCWLVLHDRRWLWSLLALIPVIALAAFRVGPFAGLVIAIDYDWWELIYMSSGQIYLGTWEPRDWCIVLADFYFLYLLSRRAQADSLLAQFCAAALAAFAIGMTFSAVLADLLQLVLPVGLQSWRVLWLVHWLAMAGIPYLVWEQWQRTPREWVPVVLLVAIALTGASISRITLPWAVLGLIPLHILWPHVTRKVSAPTRAIVLVGLVAVIVAATFRYQMRAWLVFEVFGGDFERVRQDVVILGYPLFAGALSFGLVWLYGRGPRWGALLGALSIVGLVGSFLLWDSRSPWTRVMEGSPGTNVFGVALPRDASVYWYATEPSPLGPWLVLNRANYFSIFQLSGQMFNRGTSMQGIQRQLQVGPVNSQGEICDMVNAVNKDPHACWIGKPGLQYMCSPYRDVPAPDYFVLPFRQQEHVLGSWTPRHPDSGTLLGTFYLYRCSDWAGQGIPESENRLLAPEGLNEA